MCYHASVGATYKQLEMEYERPFEGDFPSFSSINEVVGYHLNGFDFPNFPVITSEKPNSIQFHKWGLIPAWISNFEQANTFRVNTLNAKTETIFEKPSFKNSILNKRCLIPATGFFEWKQELDKSKTPYYIHLKDQSIFSFAGIFDYWFNPAENSTYKTFSILTMPANPLMETIHNTKKRMPLILTKEQESVWVNLKSTKEDIQACFLGELNYKLEAYTISKLISSKKHPSNVAEVLKPYSYIKPDLFT
ncbi:MAG: hypothetical protein CFE21_06655 [Bacteroidetes bacterium B1(2017)]|nr:MAG: hypothetical protein CFE21_06655 [Bacteroidetes bacterium B1(2017)]